MITINAKTGKITNTREHEPQKWSDLWIKRYGELLNITPGYIRGQFPPDYPMPAVVVDVRYVSCGCDEPMLVAALWMEAGKAQARFY